MSEVNRREFLAGLGMSALLMAPATAQAAPDSIQPIAGSWFEFQHASTVEGVDWNPACARFSARQWEAKVREIAETGMEYLVLMSTALYDRTFYDSSIFAKWDLACPDPVEAVLAAADTNKLRIFIGNGFYGDWKSSSILSDPATISRRLRAMEELSERYGHHHSFYGWYFPNEAYINGHYSDEFIQYVSGCSRQARRLTPRAPILIAPYGTRKAIPGDLYVRQLDAMDVDIVAYQDEVGVRKSSVSETAGFYAALRKAHDRAEKAKIWADIEIFECEGEVYNSALMPAPFSRVLRQMQAVSPWVDKILVYQYQGMMNKQDSEAFAGCPASTKLYSDYMDWYKAQKFRA